MKKILFIIIPVFFLIYGCKSKMPLAETKPAMVQQTGSRIAISEIHRSDNMDSWIFQARTAIPFTAL